MGNSEEEKAGESLDIRVIRRGDCVQSGRDRSYGFIILLLVAIGVFVYMKWFNKADEGKKGGERQPAAAIAPGKPASDSESSGQHDIPIPSESGRR